MFDRLTTITALFAVAGLLPLGCAPPDYNEYVEGTTAYTSSDDEPTGTDEVVPLAAVGERLLVLDDFRRRLNSLSPQARSAMVSTQGRLTLLQAMVAVEGLAQEAERTGFGDDPTVFQARAEALADVVMARVGHEAVRSVDESDISGYYAEHRELYDRPGRAQVALALFDDQSAAGSEASRLRRLFTSLAMRDELAIFAETVEQHSIESVSRERGGDLGLLTFDELEARFGEAVALDIFETESAGRVMGPFETQSGWAVLMVLRLRLPRAIAFESARDEIEARLLAESRDAAAYEWLAARREEARIEIDSELLAAIESGAPDPSSASREGPVRPDDSVLDALLSPRYDISSLPPLTPPLPSEGSGANADSVEQ